MSTRQVLECHTKFNCSTTLSFYKMFPVIGRFRATRFCWEQLPECACTLEVSFHSSPSLAFLSLPGLSATSGMQPSLHEHLLEMFWPDFCLLHSPCCFYHLHWRGILWNITWHHFKTFHVNSKSGLSIQQTSHIILVYSKGTSKYLKLEHSSRDKKHDHEALLKFSV